MPGTGARANELRSKPIKTQTLRPEAGLLQMHPVDTTPLCPGRVPERMNYARNHNPSARGLASYKYISERRISRYQPTYSPCRSSPRERMNYARNHNPLARGLASYKCTL
jgi:hypothetical protein